MVSKEFFKNIEVVAEERGIEFRVFTEVTLQKMGII